MEIRPNKNGSPKSAILAALPLACTDELAAVEFFEAQRWGGTVTCPHCTSGAVYQMKARDKSRNARLRWRCRGCDKQFTVRTGTVLENSKIPLRHWAYAFWAACASKKGVSSLQVSRQTGLSYESALFLMHRIRHGMAKDHENPVKMNGVIEADELYVGGKPRRDGPGRPGPIKPKVPIIALVNRSGEARAMVATRVTSAAVTHFIRRNVDTRSTLMTDEAGVYKHVGSPMAGGHQVVNHSAYEYARGICHTNSVEGFFSIVRRSIHGTYHSVSRQHLPRYVGQWVFMHNTRRAEDGERVRLAIQSSIGKRLFCQAPRKAK